MTSSSDNKMWILTHTNSDRGSCCTVGSLVPRRPRLCPDINHLSVFCFSLPFSKVGMILMTSTCEALGNQVPPAVGQNSSKTEWSTPLSQLREERNPSCIVFCAESTSKAVAGTHNRGQFTMDCAVHSLTMLGTGEAPDPTLLLQRANLGVQDRWEDKASLALPRMRKRESERESV